MTPIPHQELCDHLLKPGKRKKLQLMPRGSFKSSVVTVGGTCFELLRNPNLRVLIASETQRNAIKYVREIKEKITNPLFKDLFGNWQSKSHWRDYEFSIATRTHPTKEPSVMGASLEKQTVVGLHFDLIILDDVVSRTNSTIIEQIEKTIDYYKLLLAVLEPDGRIWINGTKWSTLDLYSFIMDKDNREAEQFDIFIRQAVAEDGQLLMPNVLTQEFLDDQRRTQGDVIFQAQYQNEAISDSGCSFRSEHILFYDTPPRGLRYFMTVDPAVSQGKESDYSAIIVNGVDYNNHWWILEALQLKVEISDLIQMIFTMARKYEPLDQCGMEKFQLEQVLRITIQNEQLKQGFFFPLKELEQATRISKEARIRALQPKFAAREVHLRKEHSELYHQICFHPQLKHDDLIDALKNQLKLSYPSDVKPDDIEAQAVEMTKEQKLNLLPFRERRIWENIDKEVRSVRRTKWTEW
jgi:predicted phage terminase large subunit-like protein